ELPDVLLHLADVLERLQVPIDVSLSCFTTPQEEMRTMDVLVVDRDEDRDDDGLVLPRRRPRRTLDETGDQVRTLDDEIGSLEDRPFDERLDRGCVQRRHDPFA